MNLSWAFVLIPTSSLRASFTRGRVGTNMRTPPIGEKVPLQAPSRCCAARHSALLLLLVVRKRPGAYDFSARAGRFTAPLLLSLLGYCCPLVCIQHTVAQERRLFLRRLHLSCACPPCTRFLLRFFASAYWSAVFEFTA